MGDPNYCESSYQLGEMNFRISTEYCLLWIFLLIWCNGKIKNFKLGCFSACKISFALFLSPTCLMTKELKLWGIYIWSGVQLSYTHLRLLVPKCMSSELICYIMCMTSLTHYILCMTYLTHYARIFRKLHRIS